MPRPRKEPSGTDAPLSQTLDRGITALELIALAEEPVEIGSIAEQMGVHKSVAYRLVRTLESRNLIRKTADSRFEPSLYLGRVAANSFRPLQTAATPHMRKLANALGHTVYVAIREAEEVVTICVEEPTTGAIAYRPSIRHALGKGSTTIALYAGARPTPDDSRDVIQAREKGYAVSTGEVIPGLSAVASPILTTDGECIGVLGAVFLNRGEDVPFIGRKLLVAAHRIGEDVS